VFMTREDINAAFGLSDECSDLGQGMLDEWGGGVALPGSFIRHATYLNIPGPGTGHDGDANISVKLWEETKEGVVRLLNGS